ncbi:McrBC 5-methylcytosine restriction system component [Tenacibaculum sp. MAR_2009_124]|uniref:5-methylcytosine restriction system specificity protein McrC n=1 Tax=Tenacibaculum sp. MAR_2009_124 TaxID=1250059 RepID=UPI00089941D9|nr:hypothetical protein [Tenacibaculum sp. MAR_2009_124]SEB35752.1 McrBC 5-methylcytosine restriction system component [Tenacibaculum sp. MAR_2009_124]
MITLTEHTGSSVKEPLKFEEVDKEHLKNNDFVRFFGKKEDGRICYQIRYDKEKMDFQFNSSYMVGLDWVIPNKVSIQVLPKLNNEEIEVDFLSMLFEALKETENLKHIEGLCEIDFKAPRISVQQQQDVLTPFLLIQFLSVLQVIVKKGLRKSYYKVSESLNGRVKGKIGIANTVKKHHIKKKLQYTYCTYEEFGVNTLENKILKKGLFFCMQIINEYAFLKDRYIYLLNYLQAAFEKISDDVSIKEIKHRKKNPFYKEYDIALKLAEQILKKYDYNITKTSETLHETFPFWLDMSKLFELYVFKKLKERFPLEGEVVYHKKYHRLEPDFIVKESNGDYELVVDAKYKPRYEKGNILHKDAAQVSGYTRLKSIRKELGCSGNEILKALIIFTSKDTDNQSIEKEDILNVEDKRYKELYKYSISLPKILQTVVEVER